MSMHAEYVRETLGDEIIEKSTGFATYRFLEDSGVKAVYIVDIFVKNDFRKSGVASDIADEVVEIAKAKVCKRLIGTVNMSIKDPTRSAKVLFGYGMQLYTLGPNSIIFKKELI